MNAPICAGAKPSHVWTLINAIVAKAAKFQSNGPTIEDCQELSAKAQLLEIHLRNVSRPRKLAINQLEHLAAENGNHIRTIRKEQGVTLRMLAARADLGEATVCECENGISNPTMTTQIRIGNALQVAPADIWPALKACKVTK